MKLGVERRDGGDFRESEREIIKENKWNEDQEGQEVTRE